MTHPWTITFKTMPKISGSKKALKPYRIDHLLTIYTFDQGSVGCAYNVTIITIVAEFVSYVYSHILFIYFDFAVLYIQCRNITLVLLLPSVNPFMFYSVEHKGAYLHTLGLYGFLQSIYVF